MTKKICKTKTIKKLIQKNQQNKKNTKTRPKTLILGGQMAATKFYAEYLKNDKKRLVHLDLSFNNFHLEESKTIQTAISENHNLFGFHFRGNFGFMDSKGYLQIPNDFEKEPMIVFAPKNRIKGKHFVNS